MYVCVCVCVFVIHGTGIVEKHRADKTLVGSGNEQHEIER